MTTSKRAFERAMRLAAVSGIRSTFGVALLEAAYNRPNRKYWAMAALGEAAVDKVPFAPSRAGLLGMLPRAAAGAYVANEVMAREGVQDPWIAPMGGAVAAGVGALASRARGLLHAVGISGVMLGLAEDYFALKVGGEAVGLSMDDLKAIGAETVDELKAHFQALMDDAQPKPVTPLTSPPVSA